MNPSLSTSLGISLFRWNVKLQKYWEERAEKKSARDTIDRRHAKDESDSRREIELICSFSSFSDSFASSSFFLQA